MNAGRRFKSIAIAMVLAAAWLAIPSSSSAAGGSSRQALTTSILRVCADPANLPYSDQALKGFENRIIDLVASKLGLKVHYTWFPQSTGFVRNTLRLRDCDLVSGITTTSEKVQNTNPYYRSVYTMVYREDSAISATTMSDPQLRDLKLGVVAGTPPVNIIARLGLLANIKPYQLVVDTRRFKPARQAIFDVASGVTDVAFIWGPIAAYYARESGAALRLVPLTHEDKNLRHSFSVSMAVRYNETDWKREINAVLSDLQPEINRILRDFDVPLVDARGQELSQ